MTTYSLTPELIENLKSLAAEKRWMDKIDSTVMDLSGGNVDDAYLNGACDGETHLARKIIKLLGIK